MVLVIWFNRPFCEPILNYTNIATELALGIIFGVLAVLEFDISEFTKKNVNFALIVLINIIVAAHIAGSLVICIKTIRVKIKNRKLMKVENSPGENKEFKIEIGHLGEPDTEFKKNVMFLKNKLHPSPVYSADNSLSLGCGSPYSVNESKSFFGITPGENSLMNSVR